MAHQSNVYQVGASIPSEATEKVVDPVCGMELDKKTVRNMLFRDDGTFYFCSKDCQTRFPKIKPDQRKGQDKKAA